MYAESKGGMLLKKRIAGSFERDLDSVKSSSRWSIFLRV